VLTLTFSLVQDTHESHRALTDTGSDCSVPIDAEGSALPSLPSPPHSSVDSELEPTVGGVPFSYLSRATQYTAFRKYWHENHSPCRSASVGTGADGQTGGAETREGYGTPSRVDCDAPTGWLGKLYQAQPAVMPEASDHRSFSRAILGLS